MISPQSDIRASVSSSTTNATSFGAGRNGGENGPRPGNGSAKQETHEELCARLAAMSELEYQKCRDDEAHKLRIGKSALDSLRKEGQKRAKEEAKARAQQDGAADQKQRRLSDEELDEARREIEEIAQLDGLALSRRISDIAAKWGLSPSDIRAEVRSVQKRLAEEAGTKDGGNEVAFDDPEPWDYPVDGRALLNEIRAAIADNMDLPPHVADLCALWIAHTYCYRLFDHSIRFAIMSPQPRCGKTRLQDLIALMVWRAMQAANITPAAMFRLVAHYGVTLIIDEVDSFLTGPNASEESRGILNAGHGRNGQVLRCEGDDHKIVAFPCYGPVVLGGIGSLPTTIADRSAFAYLERKRPDKKLDRIDFGSEKWPRIRRQLRRWVDDRYEDLASARPDIPSELTDRQADGWRALLAIAEVAGGKWPEKAAATAIGLSGAEPDSETIEVQLLADIFELFHDNKGTADKSDWEPRRAKDSSGAWMPRALPSKFIAETLNTLDDRPWAEWKKGKGLSSSGLTRLLGKFRIRSRQLIGKPGIDAGANPKGFEYEQFSEVWAKYLDPKRYSAKTRRNPPKTPDSETLNGDGFSVSDSAGNPQEPAIFSGLAVSNGVSDPGDHDFPEQGPGEDGDGDEWRAAL